MNKGDTMIEKLNEKGWSRSRKVWCEDMHMGLSPCTCFVRWSERSYYDRDDLQPVAHGVIDAVVQAVDDKLVSYDIVPRFLVVTTVTHEDPRGADLVMTMYVSVALPGRATPRRMEGQARFSLDMLEDQPDPGVIGTMFVNEMKRDWAQMRATS